MEGSIASCKLNPDVHPHQLKVGAAISRREVESYDGNLEIGGLIQVQNAHGHPVGMGFVNPLSRSTVRIISEDPDETIDRGFFQRRITTAAKLREWRREVPPAHRLVFDCSDQLPGLIVDRLGAFLVIQILNQGMERFRADLIEILTELFEPEGIYERSIGVERASEGLEARKQTVHGTCPDVITLDMNGITQVADLSHEDGPCWLEQRENYQAAARYVSEGDRVLDAYTHTGGFALAAAANGAQVVGLDASGESLALAQQGAELNALALRCDFHLMDLANGFQSFAEQTFDMIVLDPSIPSKHMTSLRNVERYYAHIHAPAFPLLKPDGILVSCSRSHHLDAYQFLGILRQAALEHGRQLTALETLGQPWDYPAAMAFPETRFLTCVVTRVA